MKTPHEIINDLNLPRYSIGNGEDFYHVKNVINLIRQAQNDALEEASKAVKEPYLQNGMTNLASRAYQSIQKLKR